MPKDGFKSITVKENAYDEMYKFYQKNQKLFMRKGVSNFASFVTMLCFDKIDDLKKGVKNRN